MQAPQSSSPSVLLVDADDARARTWTEALESCGAHVLRARDLAGALRAPLADRAAIACDLPDGSGLDLFGELKTRDARLAAVLLAATPDHTATRAAWRAGALDLWIDGEPLEPTLARLLAPLPAAGDTCGDALELRVDRIGAERALRELGALALRHGRTPATRARLLTAVAEALDNAERHAFAAGRGPIDLTARVHEGGLWVAIRDGGRGCDAATVELESTAAALPGRPCPGGLARMRALVESFRFESSPGSGASVELVVRDHGAALDGGHDSDLTDRDYLSPARARRLLLDARLRGGEGLAELSPAMAVLAGRLLSCTSDDRQARTALWSRDR